MRVVLSPYHLTTREPPAMASLLLAEHVVTMMPAPLTDFGHSDLHAAVRASPRYMRFIESWSWSLPLWRERVIASTWHGQDPASEVRDACRTIDELPDLEPLRPLMRRSLFEDQREYLDLLATDLLKGGPDPAISVPMAAGLDRFATRHALMVARSEPASVAQRAEIRCGTRAFAVALPVLLQAGGPALLRAREALDDELRALRHAITDAAETAMHSGQPNARHADALQTAAARYSASFDNSRSLLCESPRDEERIIDGFVTITALVMPHDASLRASLAAVRLLGSVTGVATGANLADPEPSNLPARRDPLSGQRYLTLIVKVMGRSR